MVGRNSQWTLLGLDTDPVPGDPAKLDYLMSRMHSLADDADRARRGVVGLLADKSLNGWMGASGDAFRAACAPLPDHLQKLRQSYEDAAAALKTYQAALNDARTRSASAVADGVTAYGKYSCLGDAPPAHAMDDAEYHRWVDKLGRDLILQQQKAAAGTNANAAPPHEFVGPVAWSGEQSRLVAARAAAVQAKTDNTNAANKCNQALEDAARIAAALSKITGPGSATPGLTFDERFKNAGGDPSKLILDPAAGQDVETAGMPPAGSSKEDVAAWWNRLDQAAKDRYIHEHPGDIAGLDGVPQDARDQAYRVLHPVQHHTDDDGSGRRRRTGDQSGAPHGGDTPGGRHRGTVPEPGDHPVRPVHDERDDHDDHKQTPRPGTDPTDPTLPGDPSHHREGDPGWHDGDPSHRREGDPGWHDPDPGHHREGDPGWHDGDPSHHREGDPGWHDPDPTGRDHQPGHDHKPGQDPGGQDHHPGHPPTDPPADPPTGAPHDPAPPNQTFPPDQAPGHDAQGPTPPPLQDPAHRFTMPAPPAADPHPPAAPPHTPTAPSGGDYHIASEPQHHPAHTGSGDLWRTGSHTAYHDVAAPVSAPWTPGADQWAVGPAVHVDGNMAGHWSAGPAGPRMGSPLGGADAWLPDGHAARVGVGMDSAVGVGGALGLDGSAASDSWLPGADAPHSDHIMGQAAHAVQTSQLISATAGVYEQVSHMVAAAHPMAGDVLQAPVGAFGGGSTPSSGGFPGDAVQAEPVGAFDGGQSHAASAAQGGAPLEDDRMAGRRYYS